MTLIGTKVSATLWQVTWRHVNTDKRRVLLPGEEEPATYCSGQSLVLTADPAGRDLWEVTRLAVRGCTFGTDDFTLLNVQRVADVRGLATVEGTDALPRAPGDLVSGLISSAERRWV